MQPAVLVRLRPTGPWRYGSGVGGTDRLDTLFRSDRLYSALTLAMRQLGFLPEWIEATASASEPAVFFSSLFPYQNDVLFVLPPATLWPPPSHLVTTPSPVFLSKLRWSAAQFVPVSLVETLLSGQKLLADQWIPDTESGCLLRRDRPSSSPFRLASRRSAAVDRLTRTSGTGQSTACVEFEPGSGLWTLVRFRNEEAERGWRDRVEAAFRLLSDTGFGARRSSGWGQSEAPEFARGTWPAILMPRLARALAKGNVGADEENARGRSYWLLSLFSPAAADNVDWTNGSYELEARGGYVEASSPGSRAVKQQVRMVAEGSVLSAPEEPIGRAVDVAPDGFSHPVYRSGFALAFALPALIVAVQEEGTDVPTADAEAVESQDQIVAAETDNGTTAVAMPTAVTDEAPGVPDDASGVQEETLGAPEEPVGVSEENTPSSDIGIERAELPALEPGYAEPSFEDGGDLHSEEIAEPFPESAADDSEPVTATSPENESPAPTNETPHGDDVQAPKEEEEEKEPGDEV